MLPKAEDCVWILHILERTSLLRVDEIWKLEWIIDEKYWSVVPNQIIISLFGIEFDSEASWVSECIRSSSFSSHSRKPCKHWCLLSNTVQKRCLCILADVLLDLKYSMSSRPNRMHNSLRNSFSIKASKLINEMKILQKNWTSSSRSH